MKKKIKISIVLFLIAFVILITLKVLSIPIFEYRTAVDLNSGDSRIEKYVCFFRAQSRIGKTSFSKEVQRLHIEIPNERRWIFAGGYTDFLRITGIHRTGHFTNLPVQFEIFISYFDKGKMPDIERITFLKEALVCMKKDKASDVEDALEKILNKLREEVKLENRKQLIPRSQ